MRAGWPRRYTVRYRGRAADRTPALVVEDERGTASLFHRGRLPVRLIGADAAARLPRLLRGWGGWARVPAVAPSTLDELRRLVGGHCLARGVGGERRAAWVWRAIAAGSCCGWRRWPVPWA